MHARKSSHMQWWRLALKKGKQLEMLHHLHYNSINYTEGGGGVFIIILLKYARGTAASGYEDGEKGGGKGGWNSLPNIWLTALLLFVIILM